MMIEELTILGWELDSCVKGTCYFMHKNYNITTKNEWVLWLNDDNYIEIIDLKNPVNCTKIKSAEIKNVKEVMSILKIEV